LNKTNDLTESLYDREIPEEDLWFLPGPPEDAAPTDPPWTIADRRPLFDGKTWLKAEAGQGRGLARAAATFAMLDERLRRADSGLGHRLALREVSEMMWAKGSRLSADRIALYDLLRTPGTGDEVRELSTASWALRRLRGGPELEVVSPKSIEKFLGRVRTDIDGLESLNRRPVGEEFFGLLEVWTAVQRDVTDAHALTRAAVAFYSWRAFELSGPGELLEGAVVAGRIGAEEGRGGCLFLPVVSGDAGVYRTGGSAAEKLASWYRAVENACLRALLHLDRLEDWQGRAEEVVSDMSGRTPPKLIEALASTPMLSAEMAAIMTGASKAACLRNLVAFESRGLAYETTGQGRYRCWAARGTSEGSVAIFHV
jgi:hypothetical protein